MHEQSSSPQSGIDPRTKLAWLGSIFLLLFLFEEPIVQLTTAGVILAIALISAKKGHIAFRPLILALKTLTGMLFMMILLQGFIRPGETVLFSFPFFEWTLRFKLEGVFFGLVIAARFVSISFAFMLVFSTITAYDLSLGLWKMGIPFKFAYLISMALEKAPGAIALVRRIESAQASRGFNIEGGNAWQKFKNIIPILTPLVIINLREAQQMTIALELRGFGSEKAPTPLIDLHFSHSDKLLSVLAGLLVIAVLVIKATTLLGLP